MFEIKFVAVKVIYVLCYVNIFVASYPKGTKGSFPGGKAAEARSWPLTSI
jgi:hypothetical protein